MDGLEAWQHERRGFPIPTSRTHDVPSLGENERAIQSQAGLSGKGTGLRLPSQPR